MKEKQVTLDQMPFAKQLLHLQLKKLVSQVDDVLESTMMMMKLLLMLMISFQEEEEMEIPFQNWV